MISLRHVTKNYDTPAGSFAALVGTTLDVERGEFVAVVGKSGSGKSTLLNLVAGIDRPTAGDVLVAGTNLGTLSVKALSGFRGRTIGIVFQFFQLLPTLTVAENVMLPMELCRTNPAGGRRRRALELLDVVGIAEQAAKFPLSLSGGQQQRAAIARALANDPPVLLADEPTGNLDTATATAIFGLFSRLSRDGVTVVVATHAKEIEGPRRTVELIDGKVVSDVRPAQSIGAER